MRLEGYKSWYGSNENGNVQEETPEQFQQNYPNFHPTNPAYPGK